MTGFRTASGGRIDRATPIGFRFEGAALSGFAGDTLASALIANGVSLVARSFKYHRPRGIVAAGAEEPNALVELGEGPSREPNLRATQVELFEGLVAGSGNAWPNLALDLGAVAGRFAGLLPAGFYYKTFMWPPGFWRRVYEPAIRRMAGLGRAPTGRDPDRYDGAHVHADVLVVGGGLAGLAAAWAASRGGARVVLADEQNEFGGGWIGRAETIGDEPAQAWIERIVGALRAIPEVTLLSRTNAFGLYDQGYAMLVERRGDHLAPAARAGRVRQRLWHVRARRTIVAAGAHERPIAFTGNDLPGVMLASAAATFATRFAAAPGRRAVVFANNDTASVAAADLAAAGVSIAAIVDSRAAPSDAMRAHATAIGAELVASGVVRRATGNGALAGVEIAAGGSVRALDCDLLAVSGGWNPAAHLVCHAGGRLAWDEGLVAFRPATAPAGTVAVGAANGVFDPGAALAEGLAAGAAAASACGFGDGVAPAAPTIEPAGYAVEALWEVPAAGAGKAFVDFQNDVTTADVALAAREGFVSVEHLKRYTTAGMATDQGKTSNVAALALLAAATGRTVPETGHTTFRPPWTPVAYGALAGRDLGDRLDPIRTTPMHAWHAARGAVFEDVGQWKRPRAYPRAGEDVHAAVRREALAARAAVGVLDASTLGKIDVHGPDAARFLDRVYVNTMSTLPVGRCRYGLMCREDGMVFDDGVVARLADDRFHVTTTTGGAARVLDWLEEWLQTEWPELRLHLTSTTEHWAVASVSGPRARDLVATLKPDFAIDADVLPFMAWREGRIAGLSARLFRVSFTGESAFEINVPSQHGLALWEAIASAGLALGLTPYGTDAMHLLRAEKGYVIVGQETDGSVTPDDLGLGRMVAKAKDFLGKRSLARPDTTRADRKQLVGLLPEDKLLVLPEGAQLVSPADSDAARAAMAGDPVGRAPVAMLGHVTSSYMSPNLGRGFALALIAGGRTRQGETVVAAFGATTARATIVAPVFWDPEGVRLHG